MSDKKYSNHSASLVPRNPVARSPLLRKGGVHEKTATAKRQQANDALSAELEDWREDLAFEQSLKQELEESQHQTLDDEADQAPDD